ncbi:DNA sulfur modification protein DndD [Streptosporangium sp. NPDC051023]|uniref:DNA sulfur modification protein DndD n=1 Tax=Streptosporangium sp. NPDC051023 TaxID=3155410 RepID=UPI00344DF83F
MLLHEITLENVGAYKGKQRINLEVREGRPIILIGGLNGCGKTTLLDAIQHALYGSRARCSGRGTRSYDAYLRDTINREASPKDARITLRFSTTVEGEQRHYRVVRAWQVRGKSVREFLNVFINGELDPVASESWADYIEDLLPLEVASLFFFDGEKIESLADPERAAPVIESAVHSLLGVNTVEQLRTDLLALQRRQKVSDEDQQALEQIKLIEQQISEADQACADSLQRVASAQASLDVAEAALVVAEDAFATKGGNLYQRRAELEAEKKLLEDQLQGMQDNLANHVAAGPLPLLLLSPQLEQIKKQAEREEAAAQAGQVLETLATRDQQLLDFLNRLVGSEPAAEAEKYLVADRLQRATEADTPRFLELSRSAAQQLASLDQILDKEHSNALALVDEVTRLRERLNTVERQLAAVPDEQMILSLVKQLEAARLQVAGLKADLGRAREAHATADNDRKQLVTSREHAYKKRASGLAKAEHVARIITYADRVRTTLQQFGDALLRRHINALEVAVLDSFTRLMRKSGLVQDLRIDTDKFTLTLIGADGEALDPTRLSAGERQLLAVSLLWGLARVAGNRLPTVIDTPLGRLDSRHRQNLVERYFPQAGDQVLLLSTDEEIDEYLLSRLKPAIAQTYTLVHDDQTFTTTIEHGYWWQSGAPHVA